MSEDLRSTISALVDKSEAGEPLTETPVVETPTETPQVETEEKAGRTAGRPRDEKGRLLPGKVEKPLETAPETPVEVKRPPRPSSWKKDYWEHWDKLDPTVAEYINQREQEYTKGVSTYKQEFDQLKPLQEAVAPYLQDLQRAGVTPAQAISKLAATHKALLESPPQQKLQLFAKLCQDYQVPIQALYDPNFAQQFALQAQIQPQTPQVPVETLVEQKMSEFFSKQQVEAFGADTEKYPHFEAVRNKMAQLLESGLAEDLEGAYHAAVKLDDELWNAEQQAKVKAEEAKRLEDQRKAVTVAKGNTISPKSATPASGAVGAKKGLRETLSEAFDTHLGGRV